jgi:hypothetical protein
MRSSWLNWVDSCRELIAVFRAARRSRIIVYMIQTVGLGDVLEIYPSVVFRT